MKITEESIIGARIDHQFPHEDGVQILARAGGWPVSINIAADRIEVSVWAVGAKNAPQRIRDGIGLGWTLRDGEEAHSGNINAYEFIGVNDYRGEKWMTYHHMTMDCPTITSRRDWLYGKHRMEISGRPFKISRWSEGMGLNNGCHTAYDEDGLREDMRQRLQAYQWLMPIVDALTDPDSELCVHADKIAHAVLMESDRADYENETDKRNRPMVMDDCFGEIIRAHGPLALGLLPRCAFEDDITSKNMTALNAAVYGVAMGEDYSKAGDGWSDIVRNGRRFSPKDVEEYYTHAAEFNADRVQKGGVLVNMWNALANHADHVAIADYADALIEAVDMKTVHDKSEAKWFNWQVREDAYAENAKIRLADYAAATA